MTTAAIISGLAIPILGFILWFIRRRIETVESKADVSKRYEQELHNALGSAKQRDINLLLDKRLSDISRYQQGQGSSQAKGGSGIQDAK